MGIRATPRWHNGNGPDQPPTSIHWSGDGLRQGETAANVFFNIMSARLYNPFTKILNGRGILLVIADDVKICTPPSVLAEIVGKLPALAMYEAWLTTQASKNRIYVHPSAKATAWCAYLEANHRCEDASVLSLHDSPNGRLPVPVEFDKAYYAPHQGPS